MLPLKHERHLYGSFVIDSKQPYFFAKRPRRLAEAAAEIGGAILRGRKDAYDNIKVVKETETRRVDAEKMQLQLAATEERANNDKVMRDAFEDVSHQINGPLAGALRRILESREHWERTHMAPQLSTVISLLARAEGTAKLINLFSNLARGERLMVTGRPLAPVDVVRIANEICLNEQPRISPRRSIKIDFDADSFTKHAPVELPVDQDFFVQALNNLVENAVKYSYSRTIIKVFAGILKGGGFYIAVTNEGIPISRDEVNSVRQRHWRGEKAKLSVGDGNGLGLYIVDNIMKAHNGELQVLPTRQTDGVTEVRLVFFIKINK